MDRNIVIEKLNQVAIPNQKVELVERKGIGHPDSIADGLAESVSQGLCKMYLARYNQVLHHNTDETEVVGGQSSPKFGGGEVLEPVYILLIGRAITQVNGERLPFSSVAIEAAKNYLNGKMDSLDRFPDLDVENGTIVDVKIGKGSQDLIHNFENKEEICEAEKKKSCLPANDTSFGVSFAPFSQTEKVTLECSNYINGPMRRKIKGSGQDVKVMACRKDNKMTLTVACAMVDRYIDDADAYKSTIHEMGELIADHACKFTDYDIIVDINHADNYEGKDESNYYLTVTGLSMENGDDGSVGRGNRVNGLITPYRPMSMEASAGKNPITHVGKIYNILSNQIANKIADEAKGDIEEVRVRILSQIGSPIDFPQVASIQIINAPNTNFEKMSKKARDIADYHLANIEKRVTKKVVKGEISVF